MSTLTSDQLSFWKDHRYLTLRNYFSGSDRELLLSWVDELASWPEAPGKYMQYFEKSKAAAASKLLCRVEYFLDFHAGLRELVIQNERILSVLAELMGEPAVLFKEKINFKMPGGDGFAAHQDAPAFSMFGHTYHITLMVPLDDFNAQNGGLELIDGYRDSSLLPQERDGTLSKALESQLPWRYLEAKGGDLIFFDSYLPHRSGPNRSDHPRRAMYITYNRASEGDVRSRYFADKRRCFPPECERDPRIDYAKIGGAFNLGNPID